MYMIDALWARHDIVTLKNLIVWYYFRRLVVPIRVRDDGYHKEIKKNKKFKMGR